MDVHVHDTYFVIAHFHFIMVGGSVMAYMGGLHYWWPKMTGRLYPDALSRVAALIIFIGFVLTFLPQFVVGHLGMLRRIWEYSPEYQVHNVLSTAGASILGVGYALPLFYLIWSLGYGKKAGPNPWQATGLEWQTAGHRRRHVVVGQLPGHAGGDAPALQLRGGAACRLGERCWRNTSTTWASSTRPRPWACGSSWPPS